MLPETITVARTPAASPVWRRSKRRRLLCQRRLREIEMRPVAGTLEQETAKMITNRAEPNDAANLTMISETVEHPGAVSPRRWPRGH